MYAPNKSSNSDLVACPQPDRVRHGPAHQVLFTIQVPAAPTLSTSTYPVSLLVASIGGPEILKIRPLPTAWALMRSVYTITVVGLEPPVEMLKSKLILMLRSSGRYQSVTGPGSASEGQFVVRGQTLQFRGSRRRRYRRTRVHGF